TLTVYYHGTLTPEVLPQKLIVAAARLKPAVKVRVIGRETLGNVGYVQSLVAAAKSAGASEIFEVIETVAREDLLHLASRADVGVALVSKTTKNRNMQHIVGASNKVFDYMACGLPLLVSDLPEWEERLVKPGFARACDPNDVESIEVALR